MDQYELDARLSRALEQLGYKEPTAIQAAAIPLALNDRKDIVARARTGSGKTAAYLIPIIEMILRGQDSNSLKTVALILVPSKELANQVTKVIGDMTMYCSRQVSVSNLAQAESEAVERSVLQMQSSILVSTPSRVVKYMSQLEPRFLVIDEADLILSYGYEEDMEEIAKQLRSRGSEEPDDMRVQTFITSATLSSETDTTKQLFCHAPAILKLQDTVLGDQLLQYHVDCDSEEDKFLLAYVIFKLQLIKGKTIIFVNDIDRCYRLKLYLQQFGIRSCVLNSELPVSSRLSIVEAFNKDVYKLMIASDSREGDLDLHKEEPLQEQEPQTKKTKTQAKDSSYSRGIDFVNVSCVVNFDMPESTKQYTHRIGRTARANKTGTALTFVLSKDSKQKRILDKIVAKQSKAGTEIKPYAFDMKQVDGFRYRMEDAMRLVTRRAVRQARLEEIKRELIASDKLKRHFEENPEDLASVSGGRIDGGGNSVAAANKGVVHKHLRNVPGYLVPQSRRIQDTAASGGNRVQKPRSRVGRDALKTFRR